VNSEEYWPSLPRWNASMLPIGPTRLTEMGEQVPGPACSGVRARILGWLAQLFSVAAVLPFLERAEHADAGKYQGDLDATAVMAIDERSHARVLTHLRESDGSDDPRCIQRRERWHRGGRSGALRAAVFGVNDGLVSNTSRGVGFDHPVRGSGGPVGRSLLNGRRRIHLDAQPKRGLRT
jgi:hypothetical protein